MPDGSAVADGSEAPDGSAGPDERRARVLSARRRLLAMLLVLVAGAAVIAVAKLAAWWVVFPPTIMLAGYLGLLREAAKADAERKLAEQAAADRTRSARMEARMAAYTEAAARRPEAHGQPAASGYPIGQPATADAQRTTAERPAAPSQDPATAEVLDISARVAEEPYDQYTDAGLRAVGD